MTKELFVSSTPHETKVGLVEDDLLAEIYLERENEYTLAGSIYKGRVTRVLPGMQSAFVDIGLERDAFLYVSDFMELEDSEDLDEVPTNRPGRSAISRSLQPMGSRRNICRVPAAESQPQEHLGSRSGTSRARVRPRESSENRGGMRGRRRRRGRRGERMPESRFAQSGNRNAAGGSPYRSDGADRTHRTPDVTRTIDRNVRSDRNGRPERNDRPERSEYGPPPGYQPIILPGESISKYQRLAQARPAPGRKGLQLRVQDQPASADCGDFCRRRTVFCGRFSPCQLKSFRLNPAASSAKRPQPSHGSRVDDASSAWDREQSACTR